MMRFLSAEIIDMSVVLIFLTIWFGYATFARKMSKKRATLSSVLIILRIDWMRHLLERDNRILDAALMGNIEKNINFFASTTLFIIAGALTALTSAGTIHEIVQHVPWVWPQTVFVVQFKILAIIVVLVYAFFKYTWALRQYGFASVMIGAAPNTDDPNATEDMKKAFAVNAGKLIDQAQHNFNSGMRSYYFALSIVGWFIHPLLFIGLSLIVMRILYLREFRSRSLKTLVDGLGMSQYYRDNPKTLKVNGPDN
ncbi:DUF599 domain-containing protein [Catenovulum adriaticum]|uniref:DUF599 domain-containing protein n=1 Tax=Catenovulum adriaticum TaxID=2984846 RepID=A0ABY7APH3_9ALTE|nr:DUF599 domain-containing protein [Catenovulum sp. TS8]WAJ71458.1 DUF599 domain-containing protein [Catenovulum sp. TS8]